MLFDGTDPDSLIVGLSYLVFADPDTPPEGFAGDNDPWQVHRQLCIGGGGVLGEENAAEEECTSRGGRVVPLDNLWMMHMWNLRGGRALGAVQLRAPRPGRSGRRYQR